MISLEKFIKHPMFAGGMIGHLTGEIIENAVFWNQYKETHSLLKKLILEPNFPPRGLPHTEPYNWHPFYDTFTDPLYSFVALGTGSLAEIPYQLPFILIGIYIGYRISKSPLREKLRSKFPLFIY